MKGTPLRLLIIGGGVAGPALALFLKNAMISYISISGGNPTVVGTAPSLSILHW